MNKVLREKAVDFLTRHYMYDTMNSWNGMKSFARNVKIPNIKIPPELRNTAYDLAYQSWVHDDIRFSIIGEFEMRQNNYYTIGFNGRSGGYCVLYKMQIKTLEYKTRCDRCYNPTYYEDEKDCPKCRQGTLRKLKKPMTTKQTISTNFDRDWVDDDDDTILDMLRTLVDFNMSVDMMIEEFIYKCKEVKDGNICLETGQPKEESDAA